MRAMMARATTCVQTPIPPKLYIDLQGPPNQIVPFWAENFIGLPPLPLAAPCLGPARNATPRRTVEAISQQGPQSRAITVDR